MLIKSENRSLRKAGAETHTADLLWNKQVSMILILQLAAISGPVALRHTVSRALPLLFCYTHYILFCNACQVVIQNLRLKHEGSTYLTVYERIYVYIYQ